MLEIRSYSEPELTEMFGTKSCQGLVRKLARYNVDFETDGKGE